MGGVIVHPLHVHPRGSPHPVSYRALRDPSRPSPSRAPPGEGKKAPSPSSMLPYSEGPHAYDNFHGIDGLGSCGSPIKLRHDPIGKGPNRAALPVGAGEHEMMTDIADIDGATGERGDQYAGPDFALGKSRRFQRTAETARGHGNRQEAAIKPHAVNAR